MGGDTICVPISAKNNINIDQLLEMVLLEADVLELKANPNKQSKGVVIEARLDKSKGAIATMLVQKRKTRRRRHNSCRSINRKNKSHDK